MKDYYTFDIKKSNFMKGIAIIMIIVHNYLHLLPPSVGENEFLLNGNRFWELIHIVINNPRYVISLFFSYFGHYGFQIFIFLSAYGLSKSYKPSLGYFVYLKKRFKKLYILYFSAIISYLIFNFVTTLAFLNRNEFISLIYKILFIDQFIKEEYFLISGPWWFFSLIAQFYLVFPFLYFFVKRYKNISIILSISIGYFYILLSPIFFNNINYMANIIAHLPEFILDIYIASFKVKKIRKLYGFHLFLFFIMSNFLIFLMPLSFILIIILIVIISDFLYNNLTTSYMSVFIYRRFQCFYL